MEIFVASSHDSYSSSTSLFGRCVERPDDVRLQDWCKTVISWQEYQLLEARAEFTP